MATGQLRVYLGAAPGVGKTFAMLDEGHRRLERGTDVVVGLVETHGRPQTAARLAGLEIAPRATLNHRGAVFTEMDVEALLARAPDVVLVDELAHTNVPGSRNAKRWQDVQDLLEAGITVITTVNVQHLESLNDVVKQITGVVQRETVPDAIVRRAEQVELVDMAPEALRRRMAHGNIYPRERIDSALGNYFRVGNLTALRELALLWLADKVDEQLDRYRADHRIAETWEARERVVVALTGGTEGDTLIRRGARIAARTKGADLLAVHVARNDGLADASPATLSRQRLLVESLGGTYHQVVGSNIPRALLDFARGVNATQLVLGASRRGRLAQLVSRGTGVITTAESGPIDVHLVTHESVPRAVRPGRGLVGGLRSRLWSRPGALPAWVRSRAPTGLGSGRRRAALALIVLGLPALTAVLDRLRDVLSLPSDILIFLVAVVGIALVGGMLPAVLAALAGFALLNYYFTAPIGRLTIADRENVLALLAFVLVALAVSTVVDLAARRTADAARARAEAETLSTVAGSVLRGSRPLPALLDQLRETFQLDGVTLLERRPGSAAGPGSAQDPDAWQVVAAVGDRPCRTPADGDGEVRVAGPDRSGTAEVTLVLCGHPLAAADRRVVEAFAAQAAIALRQERLADAAAEVEPLAEIDRLRTALLNAVSHDLRTPLASATAAVAGLRSADIVLGDGDRAELLGVVDESLERLARLVDDLLDLSRLQAGVLAMTPATVELGPLLREVVADLGAGARGVRIVLSDRVPPVRADAALLTRALVNLLANAVAHSPPDRAPTIEVEAQMDGEQVDGEPEQVEIRVVDHGPGVPSTDWDRIFVPFQRLGDRSAGTGVGLGLALSRGLVEAMGGRVTPSVTPGGGLTMTVTLPADVPPGALAAGALPAGAVPVTPDPGEVTAAATSPAAGACRAE